MKSFYHYLKDFIQEDFDLASYLYTAILLLITFSINYSVDFEDKVIDAAPREYRGLAYFLFFLTAWVGTFVPVCLIRKNYSALTNGKVWLLALLFLGILSFDAGFYHHRIWLTKVSNKENQVFLRKLFVNTFSMMFYVVAFYFLIRKFFKSTTTHGLGLLKSTPQWKAYLGLWALMLPLLVWASFQKDFILQYPEFKPWKNIQLFGEDPWLFVPLYEFCYAIDFLAVEWMFRGALVIGMATLLGRHALLPMVTCYAFLHFGKPMAEALGSIFGGYILGVLALRTGSIWGGCLVHIGIALTMDFLAIFQFWRQE